MPGRISFESIAWTITISMRRFADWTHEIRYPADNSVIRENMGNNPPGVVMIVNAAGKSRQTADEFLGERN